MRRTLLLLAAVLMIAPPLIAPGPEEAQAVPDAELMVQAAGMQVRVATVVAGHVEALTEAAVEAAATEVEARERGRTAKTARLQGQADLQAELDEAKRQAEEAHRQAHIQQEAQRTAATSSTVWDRLAQCESHGQWNYGPHSGWGSGIYHGGLQFHPNTWNAYGGQQYALYAYQASREQQIAVAERVLASQGWVAWPSCSRKLGLR